MGYTHYWRRPPILDETKFKSFTKDCHSIVDYCQNELGIAIGDGSGNGEPEITETSVWFNGSEEQPAGVWTTNEPISIPWPSSNASLVGENFDPSADKTEGTWFAGSLVSQRVAPINNLSGKGSGSYETFAIDQQEEQNEWQKDEPLIFNCTKTAYRPYDLTVTACLIAFKQHFGDTVVVSTDGEEKDWLDGRILCNNVLGYGMDLKITEDF